MSHPEQSGSSPQRRRVASVLLVLAWVFWLHRWAPALAVVTFVVWASLQRRVEAGLGKVLHRLWRRVWPPASVTLIALLFASTLAFALLDAPAEAKILPVSLDVIALLVILFGQWWALVALPRWLGGTGSGRSVQTSDAIVWTRVR